MSLVIVAGNYSGGGAVVDAADIDVE